MSICIQPFTIWDEELLKKRYKGVLDELHELMMKESEADKAEKKKIHERIKFNLLLQNAYLLAMNYRTEWAEARETQRKMKQRAARTKELYDKIQKEESTDEEEWEYRELVEDEDNSYYIDEDNGKYILMEWMGLQIDSANACTCAYFAEAMDVLEKMYV